MDKAIRKVKIPVYAIILAIILLAAAAVGIYLLVGGGKTEEHNRGTYVLAEIEKYGLRGLDYGKTYR